MVWIIIAILVVIFIIMLLNVRIYVTIAYAYTGDNQPLFVHVTLFKIRIFHRNLDVSDSGAPIPWKNTFKDDGILKNMQRLQDMLQDIADLLREANGILQVLLKRICVHKVEWRTSFGTGDAPLTGIVAGGLWSAKGVVISLLSGKSTMKCKPAIAVLPHFQQKFLRVKIDCIVSIKMGQAIVAFIKAGRMSSVKKEAFSTN